MRDVESLNTIVEEIADKEGRMDGLIAAAGIQQETPALEYKAKDVDLMMSVNVTGVFMTAQAVAKQMVKFDNGGSIVLIASMSGTIANRVCRFLHSPFRRLMILGSHLSRIQRIESRGSTARTQSG